MLEDLDSGNEVSLSSMEGVFGRQLGLVVGAEPSSHRPVSGRIEALVQISTPGTSNSAYHASRQLR